MGGAHLSVCLDEESVEGEAEGEDLGWKVRTMEEAGCGERTSRAREGVKEGSARSMGVSAGSVGDAMAGERG